jgi:ABC-type phosphate transport system auxiliary subunit
MKRTIVGVLALTAAAGMALVWHQALAGPATQPGAVTTEVVPATPPGAPVDVNVLKKELETLKADLAKLADEKKALAQELEKFKAEFARHTHPVLMWDAPTKSVKPWPWEPGAFFVAYPKIGKGDSETDAVAAAGTWGKP